ncbi:MAG: sugar phosphate isomerase/epimerase [Planctomycetota bacterium]|nr:sugar phosphate isomerase/epimerase [Planctomycetota bacterium]
MSMNSRRQFLASAAAIAASGALSPLTAFGRNAFETEKPRKFELGLVTYNVVKDWDLPTILRVCQEVGIAAVECRTTHRHGVEPSLSSAERKDVRRRFQDSGVVFWGCGSTCEFHSLDQAVVAKNIEECKRFVQLVADLGGRGVKVRPNGLPKEVPAEKTIAQIGSALVECGKAAQDAGVEIWVEVHGAQTQDPANMQAIMQHCGHEAVGLTWNSNPGEVKDGSIAWAFDLLKPWLRSCHINELGNDATGKYPYRELFTLLREASYDRYTLIEIGTAYPDIAAGTHYLRDYRAQWEELSKG